MTNVYTKPAYRQQGIGSTLIQHAIHWAKTEGLALMIVSPSDAAISFYRRAGFTSDKDFLQYTFEGY
jgi:ribosomal protein S18 acetylase RimI-like enzyme